MDSYQCLLVEDSKTQGLITLDILDQIGFSKALWKENLSEAIETISTQKIDIILLDLTLPDSSGLGTVEKILEGASHIPIVILSSNDDQDFASKCVEVGAQDYLVKGQFTPDYLRRSIRYSIQRKKTEIALESAHEDLKQNQARLLQSEKLASLGKLSSGVAHEINNPLCFILSNFSSFKEYLSVLSNFAEKSLSLIENLKEAPNPETNEFIEELKTIHEEEDINYIIEDIQSLIKESHEGLVRVQGIVKNLREFSCYDKHQNDSISISEAISNTLQVLEHSIPSGVQISTFFEEKLPSVHCNPLEINQVFLSIIENALLAVGEEGSIKIKTSLENNEVKVSIQDNGSGIPKEVLPKIFDPFFTTRPVGEGKGMGLSIAYSIIEKHLGRITYNSKEGEGTTIFIFLPPSTT